LLDLGPGLSADGDPGGALRSVKETLRALPAQGIGYGLLRYLSEDGAAALGRLPQAVIAFNYLGQLDTVLSAGSSLAAAGESSGLPRSPRTRRSHALEINALVAGGCLTCDWTYSERVHRRDGVERLAAGFLDALRDLIAHCRSPEAGGYTPSDFPDLQLSQAQLDGILAEVEIDFAED
jgi:non-ribosomal peptide synthase protein (TIGR01720 family)